MDQPVKCRLEQGTKEILVTVLGPASLPSFYEVEDVRTAEQFTVHLHQLMLPPTIPSRYRQKQFDQVAPILAVAFNNYPKVTKIDPSGLSLESYRNRLYDAIKAKQRYDWQWVSLPDELFAAVANKIVISVDKGLIVTGSSEHIRLFREGTATPVAPLDPGQVVGSVISDDPEIEVVDVSPRHLEHLCWLLSNRSFRPCPRFIVTGPDPATIDDLQSRYNVFFCPFENDPKRFLLQ